MQPGGRPVSCRGTQGLRRLELLFWVAGAVCLACCAAAGIEMMLAQRAAGRIVLNATEAVALGDSAAGSPGGGTASGDGAATIAGSNGVPAVIGRVEIPALGLVTPLLDGDDSMSLTQGAGHIPGTAVPGGLGTVAIAGHRDTHFRKLSHAVAGMEVVLIDHTGTYHYRVTSTEIVTPEQVDVLNIKRVPGLVLITCYPFEYIGHAPKRFVVHAELLSVAADEKGR